MQSRTTGPPWAGPASAASPLLRDGRRKRRRRQVRLELRHISDRPSGQKAPHLALESGLGGARVHAQPAVCFQLADPHVRGDEEIGGEGVEVLLGLETGRVEIGRDQVQV
eukprot:scaffold11115_cov98-Isochrysis_galbana.AAC.3